MTIRVDAHVHVWRAADGPTPGVSTLVSPQTEIPAELLGEYLAEHDVDRAVLVQPVFRGEDNSYVAELAVAAPQRFAAVCVVHPQVPGADERLAYWVETRGCKGLRLRPSVPDEAAVFGDAAGDPLWRAAARLQVVVSILGGPEHLATLAQLADRFPDVSIVIDHLAHPVVNDADTAAWRPLLQLARHRHVHVKLSGYYYFSQDRYPYRDCWPPVRQVYDAFGPSRLLWGSDFPHVLLTTGYHGSVRMLEELDWLTAGDREAILGTTAMRLYWPDENSANDAD